MGLVLGQQPTNEQSQSDIPEEYVQHKDKQDEFDWKLIKVRIALFYK